jgi:hypothetical protein
VDGGAVLHLLARSHGQVKRPKTYQGYQGICARYLVPELGRRKLERLKVQDIRGLLTRLQYD